MTSASKNVIAVASSVQTLASYQTSGLLRAWAGRAYYPDPIWLNLVSSFSEHVASDRLMFCELCFNADWKALVPSYVDF